MIKLAVCAVLLAVLAAVYVYRSDSADVEACADASCGSHALQCDLLALFQH
ncbi:hypothetical protein QU481_03110 [Crenobacter sp. SG2303]|uniref:Uncharacterized protein n=1 Tax=Crenobacter oryzisoli TaxID=3056844 RepID=A0ABT7XJG4_9NEIS|nr:hypothetical protein [Crenobacter sp. SG2303]MDN0073880.1 hypothetical protein [Crenobacter sp. SG2303]